MTRKITIDPLTRLEGHGRVEIFLDGEGEVRNAYLVVPELRGFEAFCVGRPAEEMPRITARICGLCPEAHHIASAKALDDLFGVKPTPAARKVRELFYNTFFVLDHATHFFVLAGPDFLLDADTPAADRNILGVMRRMGDKLGRKILAARSRNAHALELLGGRSIHPVAALPGGWSVPVSKAARAEIEAVGRENVEFALFSLELFEQRVLGSQEHVAQIVSADYADETYYSGTVDERDRPNFYDGRIRVVDPAGKEHARYAPREYRDHIAERVESWTNMKFPYLSKVGWSGFKDGVDSGVYVTTPLSRLNVAASIATPRAQEHFERMHETLGGVKENGRYRPLHYRLATHWARLIEMLYAAERMLELATDPEITDPDVRSVVESTPSEGVGCVEAPRGTLIHHYWTDPEGRITRVNLIVGTTNNHAAIALSVARAARSLIRKTTRITSDLLNRIEMVVRSYDPCLSCATHALPGSAVASVRILDSEGRVLDCWPR